LNHRHADFQSAALPTELSGHFRSLKNLRFWRAGPFGAPKVSGVITSCSDMASAIAKFFDSFFTAAVDGWNACPAEAGSWLEIHSPPSAGPDRRSTGGRVHCAARQGPSAKGTTATSAAMTGEDAKMRLASEVTATERTTVISREFSRSRSWWGCAGL
jgi:hypothetical protein